MESDNDGAFTLYDTETESWAKGLGPSTIIGNKQENIPEGCVLVLPTCQPYVFWWSPLDVSAWGGVGG